MDKSLIEKHLYVVALLKKLGIDILEIDNDEEIFRIINQELQYNHMGIFVPHTDSYFENYKEAVIFIMEQALEDFKYNNSERQLIPIFSGAIEFKARPHIENIMNGYVVPCSKEHMQAIKDFALELATS